MATTQPVEVRSHLAFVVEEPSTITLQVAVAATVPVDLERLEVVGPDGAVPVTEVDGDHGARLHVVEAPPGPLTVDYSATAAPAPGRAPRPVEGYERIVALRQSRYCPSDRLGALATAELGPAPSPSAIGEWVHRRLRYELGSSGPADTAIDTLLAGAGVCRDFAHVTVALARALDIPARLVSAYAPGLWPMDFHAVAELAGPQGWEVVDATRLAPRPTLVRIATGRDAADTAFVTVEGRASLEATEVLAVVTGDLPVDDHAAPVAID